VGIGVCLCVEGTYEVDWNWDVELVGEGLEWPFLGRYFFQFYDFYNLDDFLPSLFD
jgi:hypothetical protein